LLDPVTLGMCSQSNLDNEITKALKRQINKQKRDEKAAALAKKNLQSDSNNDTDNN